MSPKSKALALILCLLVLPAYAESRAFFSPGIKRVINAALDEAQESVDVAAYYFTERELATTLVALHGRGVKIRIFLDKSMKTEAYSKGKFFENKGLEIRYDGHHEKMHHKFMIIDGTALITGSYNYTASAETRNAENILITDEKNLVAAYADEFERLWEGNYPKGVSLDPDKTPAAPEMPEAAADKDEEEQAPKPDLNEAIEVSAREKLLKLENRSALVTGTVDDVVAEGGNLTLKFGKNPHGRYDPDAFEIRVPKSSLGNELTESFVKSLKHQSVEVRGTMRREHRQPFMTVLQRYQFEKTEIQ